MIVTIKELIENEEPPLLAEKRVLESPEDIDAHDEPEHSYNSHG